MLGGAEYIRQNNIRWLPSFPRLNKLILLGGEFMFMIYIYGRLFTQWLNILLSKVKVEIFSQSVVRV